MDLIVAVDKNWAIGNKGRQHVNIPEDQKYFQKITMGNVIILGRKTLATFPNGLPLKGRTNIILTRDPNFTAKDAVIAHSEEELFEIRKDYSDKEIYCVGGGKIYEMLLPYCRYAYVTKIDYAYEADTYFPNLDKLENWKLIADSEEHTYFSVEFYYLKYENTDVKEIML